ncbi:MULTISPECIES: ATP-binding cassette domain-containing protein [unclassified Bradyrhizobium]
MRPRICRRPCSTRLQCEARDVCFSTQQRDKLPAELSGGAVKRVALARAFALHSVLLFLDEPISGLGPDPRREFGSLIMTLQPKLGFTSSQSPTASTTTLRSATVSRRWRTAALPIGALRSGPSTARERERFAFNALAE